MADPLLEALIGSQYKTEEDPFYLGAQVIGKTNLYNPYESTGTNVGYSLGSALLAGLLGGYAQNRVEDKNALLAQSALDLVSADPTKRTEMVKENGRLSPLASALLSSEEQAKRENLKLENEMNARLKLEKEIFDHKFPQQQELAKQKLRQQYALANYKHNLKLQENNGGGTQGAEAVANVSASDADRAFIESLPKNVQAAAAKQIGMYKGAQQAINDIKSQFASVYNAPSFMPILNKAVGRSTEDTVKYDDATQGMLMTLDKNVDGVIDREQQRGLVNAYGVTPWDDKGAVNAKYNAFAKKIVQGVEGATPLLRTYGYKTSYSIPTLDTEGKEPLSLDEIMQATKALKTLKSS